MKITDKLHKSTIIQLKGNDRSTIIHELLDHLVYNNYLERSAKLFSFIDSKESCNSSNIGRGVAFPHSISNEIKDLVCILGISRSGVVYDEGDVHPCHLVLLSLSPENSPDIHRKFISKFQLLLSDIELKESIINFYSLEKIEQLLTNWEIKQMEELL
tara:strand:- start:364 stop:837 length:474 start_codon:yes stop_codon:yes gene_type:complete